MNLNERFIINDSEVVAKIMDGEAIFINLSTGTYYSMDGVGTVAWELICRSYSVGEIIEIMSQYYKVASERIEKDILELIKKMIVEKIIIPSDKKEKLQDYQLPHFLSGVEYDIPKLNVYSDMKDLLALDPPMPKLDSNPWQDA